MTSDPARQRALLKELLRDPERFARLVLAEHCRLPFAPFHRELFAWQARMARHRPPGRRGLRFALAAPRGNAKSTIASLALPLHDIVLAREEYILLLSATERQAMQRLRAIRRELERGDAGRLPGRRSTVEADRFAARTIVFNGVRVDAMGAGTEIRGLAHGAFRPTKLILDDAESSRSATSPRARERLAAWFAEVVEYLGDVYTHIVAVGTVLHRDGLMAHLLERPDFTALRTRSIESHATRQDLWARWRALLADAADPHRRETARRHFADHRDAMLEGASVLWPEKEDYEDLMAQLVLGGRRAFQQEKQNDPMGPRDALFDVARMLHAAEEDGHLAIRAGAAARAPLMRRIALPHGGERHAHLDAAMGRGRASGEGDLAAVAVVARLADGTLLLEQLRAARMAPTRQVEVLFELHAHRPLHRLTVEGTGFQELLVPLIEEERRRRAGTAASTLPVPRVVHPRLPKAARIAALEPLLAGGRLVLCGDVDAELHEELANYPRTRHDDALDAVAGAVELALTPAQPTRWEPPAGPPRSRPRGF